MTLGSFLTSCWDLHSINVKSHPITQVLLRPPFQLTCTFPRSEPTLRIKSGVLTVHCSSSKRLSECLQHLTILCPLTAPHSDCSLLAAISMEPRSWPALTETQYTPGQLLFVPADLLLLLLLLLPPFILLLLWPHRFSPKTVAHFTQNSAFCQTQFWTSVFR